MGGPPGSDGHELVIGHGARMSWAGLLRADDEFPPFTRARLATLTSTDGTVLRRAYGAWSDRYRRFTSNLSTPHLALRLRAPDPRSTDGICCVVYWVDRGRVSATGPGSVCQGDGWPAELWTAFAARLGQLEGRSVGQQLRTFAGSDLDGALPIVAAWRRFLRARASSRSENAGLGAGWIPVPVPVEPGRGAEVAIASVSPSRVSYTCLTDALASPGARRRRPDSTAQATYYLECLLGRRHGVAFGPHDRLEDRAYEATSAVRRLARSMTAQERDRIATPWLGRLDRFG